MVKNGGMPESVRRAMPNGSVAYAQQIVLLLRAYQGERLRLSEYPNYKRSGVKPRRLAA
jgi:hypothetical protein